MKYKFTKPLEEAIIKSRPNRFIMSVKLNNKIVKCYCPTTGRVGNIIFKDIPCLISRAENSNRKTKYTVEAISLNPVKNKNKKWIGINQVKMNKYVEFFLKNRFFEKMISGGENTEREKKLGSARIDFKVGKNYIEVKTLLINTPSRFDKLVKIKPASNFNSFDRLIKHFDELGKEVQRNKSRAIILTCYQYEAKPFVRPKGNMTNFKILESAQRSTNRGVESWQANFKIDKKSIELLNYFPLKLF